MSPPSPSRVYLDHAASAPLRAGARAALLDALDGAGNASSPHAEGQRARALVEEARLCVAALVGSHPREVVFTSSGTEAVNLGVLGPVRALGGGRDHVLVAATAHESALRAAEALGGEGVRVTRLPCGRDGVLALDALERALDARVALLVLLLANNETGVLDPVAEAARLAHARGALVLVDAVHAAGRVPVERTALGADYLALSAHKIGGPQGAGALIARRGAPLEPLLHGGGQERGLRSGSEPVAALAGFGAAAALALAGLAAETRHVRTLQATLEADLGRHLPGSRVNGQGVARAPGTTSITLPGADAATLVIRLDLDGFALSTGAACASGAAEPSHVLRAMGLGEAEARATLRISLGPASRAEDLARLVPALAEAVAATSAAGGPAPASLTLTRVP